MNARAARKQSQELSSWEHALLERTKQRISGDFRDPAKARAEQFKQAGSINERLFGGRDSLLPLSLALSAQQRLRRPRWLMPTLLIALALSMTAFIAALSVLLGP